MKQSLRNPAAIAFASSPAGQKAISGASNRADRLASFAFFVGKVAFVGLVGWFAYNKIFKGFQKVTEDPNHAKSNINDTEAKARAEAVYTAMLGFGANFNTVLKNLSKLNYNGFIKVYNAFGERRGATFTKMNLVEWLQDQFNETQMTRLRLQIQGFF